MGFEADRVGGRSFVVGGLAVGSVLSAAALGLAPSYALLLALLLIGGLGNAAFHPHASSLMGQAAGKHRGLLMSLFMFGGNLGRGVAPIAATAAYLLGGRRGLLLVALPVNPVSRPRGVPGLAQQIFPENRGMASGLTLGVGNTLGSLGVAVTGLIADRYSPVVGLWFTAVALLFWGGAPGAGGQAARGSDRLPAFAFIHSPCFASSQRAAA